jgi:hypothetical protein
MTAPQPDGTGRNGRAPEAAPEFLTSVLAAHRTYQEPVFQTAAGSFDVEVRRVIEDDQAFYEVAPYYVLFERRPAEERTLQKLQEELRTLGVKAGRGR